ncbi:MAG: hypothetical protein GF383_12350 [Candidatus Lokiarchaeota archaeon]|nr:hypothetical protein [Candidatus Lokiarchaeota archaeon]
MEIINFLGGLISKNLDISPPAGRGLIKLAIKDELGPFSDHLKMSIEKYVIVIKNSLKIRLHALKIKNSSSITKFLIDKLIKSQSLLTLGAI